MRGEAHAAASVVEQEGPAGALLRAEAAEARAQQQAAAAARDAQTARTEAADARRALQQLRQERAGFKGWLWTPVHGLCALGRWLGRITGWSAPQARRT